MGLGSTRALPALPFPRTPALAQHHTPDLSSAHLSPLVVPQNPALHLQDSLLHLWEP